MILYAYGKININLNILGVYEDGYHMLDTLMSSINIYDEVEVNINDKTGIRVSIINNNNINLTHNTAYKAAKLFIEKYNLFSIGIDISIKKAIPVGAGLGGSSADGAAVLYALAKYYKVPLDNIMDIALMVGSDVPFMLYGGIKKAYGRGEVLENVAFNELTCLIAQPQGIVSTQECYKMYDKASVSDIENCNIKGDILDYNALKKNGIKNIFNALAYPASLLNNSIAPLYKAIYNTQPIAVFMSGSGSSVIGIYNNKKEAELALSSLKMENLSYLKVAISMPCGVEIIG